MKYEGCVTQDSQQIVNKYEQTQVSKIGKREMNELPKK